MKQGVGVSELTYVCHSIHFLSLSLSQTKRNPVFSSDGQKLTFQVNLSMKVVLHLAEFL